MKSKMQIFEKTNVRSVWDEEQEKWWWSIIDVIELLTGTENPRRYWSDLKRKLKAMGSQLYESIVQLKLESADGKNILPMLLILSNCLGLYNRFLHQKQNHSNCG